MSDSPQPTKKMSLKERNYFFFSFLQNQDSSEVKQSQIYDTRLCTSNQETNSQTKNKLPKHLVRSVGCRYGVQKVLLNLANIYLENQSI